MYFCTFVKQFLIGTVDGILILYSFATYKAFLSKLIRTDSKPGVDNFNLSTNSSFSNLSINVDFIVGSSFNFISSMNFFASLNTAVQ